MKKRIGLLIAVVWLVVFGLAGSSWATVYRYQDLTPSGVTPGVTVYITAINDAKQIVGYKTQNFSGTSQAFLWDPKKGETLLQSVGGDYNNTFAYGINKQGQIVGKSSFDSSAFWACLWTDPAQTPDGLLPISNYASSCANGINDAGLIVGYSYHNFNDPVSNITKHACKWPTPASHQAAVDLSTLGGSSSAAFGVNNAGQIVGTADTAQYTNHACLWNPGNTPQDLSPGQFNNDCQASVINSQGNVAGNGLFGGDPYGTAFYWDHQTSVVRVFSTGIPGPKISVLGGLANSNQVVGSVSDSGQLSPPSLFSWTPSGGQKDLNKLVANLPPGVTISSLSAISPQNGHIVGTDSRGHSCLLSPLAGSTTLNVLLSE